MADDQDRESRTEEPTEKRIKDALEKGNVPVSREAITFGAIVAIYLCLKLLAGWSAATLTTGLTFVLQQSAAINLADRVDATDLFLLLSSLVARTVLPLLAILSGLTIVAALVQNMPQIASDRIAPKASRLSPTAGLRRIFSLQAIFEFLKAVAKIGLVGLVTVLVLRRRLVDITAIMTMDPRDIPDLILDLVATVVFSLTGLSLVLAAADVAWSRFKWRRDLRMTRQEGDPFIKMRIRTVARQRVSRRMMNRLPEATLVVANPTHYAVALRYVREEGGAPLVIAKGLDHIALRIRQRAEEITIPVVENKPLARALYDTAEIDAEIPPELYKSVAEIIHFLQIRKLYTAPATSGGKQPRTSLPS